MCTVIIYHSDDVTCQGVPGRLCPGRLYLLADSVRGDYLLADSVREDTFCGGHYPLWHLHWTLTCPGNFYVIDISQLVHSHRTVRIEYKICQAIIFLTRRHSETAYCTSVLGVFIVRQAILLTSSRTRPTRIWIKCSIALVSTYIMQK